MKYDNIAIKVNSIAEKLFALEFLSRKAKVEINKIVKSDTLGNIGLEWDHVFIDGDEISAFSSLHFDAKNYKIIPFDKIFEIDSILEAANKPKIQIGKKYYWKSCNYFMVPMLVRWDNEIKYVIGGANDNVFELYDNGRKYTEAKMLEKLSECEIRE